MRFRIPENINIAPVTAHIKIINNSVYSNSFLITDESGDRQFIINQTTKTFIEKFSTPKTFKQLNEEVASEVNAPVKDIKKIIQPFFKYIKYRHFIVPENYEPIKIKTSPLFNPGNNLDQYAIEEIIDTNNEVDIYRAVDINSGKNVVIKLLKQHDKKRIEEFEREFTFLQLLSETGIAPGAYAFIVTGNYTYFIQDFINGLSLPQFINRKKKSTFNLVLKIIERILYAFKEMHALNIVHGDIHSSNILITGENKIKIIDFGLALNTQLDKDQLVNFGGAYFFMPPERIKKTTHNKFLRKPDFFSDVFQLGIVLYMLLYNEYPFNGLTWEELATAIKEKQVEFPEISQYGFAVPQWLIDIIAICVSKNTKLRFANAGEVYGTFLKNNL